jgi:hypothetical protein
MTPSHQLRASLDARVAKTEIDVEREASREPDIDEDQHGRQVCTPIEALSTGLRSGKSDEPYTLKCPEGSYALPHGPGVCLGPFCGRVSNESRSY